MILKCQFAELIGNKCWKASQKLTCFISDTVHLHGGIIIYSMSRAGLIWCSHLSQHNDGLAGNHLILCIFTTWKPDSNWCHGLCSDSSCKYVLEMKTSTGRLTDDMYTDDHSSRLGPDWRETEGTSKLPVGSCMGEHARSRTCFKCMWNVDK